MNDYFQKRRFSILRSENSLVILTLAFSVFLSAAVFAAPPSRHKSTTAAVKTDDKATKEKTKEKKSESKKKVIQEDKTSAQSAKWVRHVQEENDGSLPETSAGDFDWNDDANDVSAWLDPEKTKKLRADVLKAAENYRANWPNFPKVDDSKADSLGIRIIKVGRITFYTDLPKSTVTDDIPQALEAAIPLFCGFFNIDESRFADWSVEAFLMRNVDSFIAINALDGPPKFLYGYSMGDRIYAKDQKEGYYNRFLLLHELVHTMMHEIFGDLRPRWFSEGSAEFLALHDWKPSTKDIRIARIPESADSTPGFGRLEQIQELVQSGEAPTLYEILNFEPRDFVNVSTYSWSWALVMFLNNSPKYKDIAEVLPYWSTANDPNRLFIEAIGDRWNEFENDWADFIDRIDYRYDFESASVSEAPVKSEVSELGSNVAAVEIDLARGWQKTGISLEAGETYRIASSSGFKFFLSDANRYFDFEMTGASCQYVNGKPIGRLEAVVVPDSEEKTFYQTYGLASNNERAAPQPGGLFRFNTFMNYDRVPKRVRFTGDSETNSIPFVQDMEEEPKKGKKDDSNNETKSGEEKRYNALFPWNEAVGANASVLTYKPRYSGELYLRVNAVPGDLQKNKGTIKVQIKK